MTNALKTLMDLFKKMKPHQALEPIEAAPADESNEASPLPAELEKILSDLAVLILSGAKVSLTIAIAPGADMGLPNYPIQPHFGHRIYDSNECRKISKKSRAFLTKMENE